MESNLEFVYLLGGLVLNGIAIIATSRHQENRLTRIETYLAQCCEELKIHHDQL